MGFAAGSCTSGTESLVAAVVVAAAAQRVGAAVVGCSFELSSVGCQGRRGEAGSGLICAVAAAVGTGSC